MSQVRTCHDWDCQDDDHLVDSMSQPGRMVHIREHIVRRGSGCHEWQGSYSRKGRPVMDVGTRKPNSVQRFNWCVEFIPVGEPWPTGPMSEPIMTCDNSMCVNPQHMRMPVKAEQPRDDHQLVSIRVPYRP